MSLTDGHAVASVMDSGGGAGAMSSDGLWLQMSTVGPEATDALAALAARTGVTFVDAPVSGSKEPAERGTLTVLASGPDDPAVRARYRAVFDVVGSRTVWVGPAGAGSRPKLVINGYMTTLVAALAEALQATAGLGLDRRRLLEVLDGGPLGVPYLGPKGAEMLAEQYPPSFSLRLAHKDLELLAHARAAAGLEMPLVETVARRFAAAMDAGHGDQDLAVVYEADPGVGHQAD
jgi:3-hydroxyisobutyrate dehydrogenase